MSMTKKAFEVNDRIRTTKGLGWIELLSVGLEYLFVSIADIYRE